MSKAVLVMDMPSSCSECRFCRELDEGINACCEVMDDPNNSDYCRMIDVSYPKTIPDWCPLRELPSKYAEKDFTPIKDERYDNGYEDGYNACIDELLKGEEG